MRYITIYLILLLSLPSMAADYFADYYRQVTSNEEIIEGREYIIVHKANVNFNYIMGIYSSDNNIEKVELNTNNLINGKIPYYNNMGKYTLEKKENDEAWYIKDQNENYLTNKSGNLIAKSIITENSRFGINIESNGEATIKCLENEYTLQYKSSNNTKKFTLASPSSSYGKVCLYYKYKTMYARTPVTAGNYGTVCIPYSADATESNAEFYEIKGKTTSGDKVSSIIITPVTILTAGTPYIFQCNETALEMPYTGERVAEPQPSTGMVGTFVQISKVPAGNYLLSSNQIRKITQGSSAGIQQYRAYLSLDDVPELTGPLPAKAKTLGNSDNTTDIDIIKSSATPSSNSYNMQGQRVAPETRGIVIINGKKRLNK